MIAENNLHHLKLKIRRKLNCNPVPVNESSGVKEGWETRQKDEEFGVW